MDWKPEPRLLSDLEAAIPDILASQNESGQFGVEPWISTDQNVLLALAAAWHLEDNRYHHDGAVLDAMRLLPPWSWGRRVHSASADV